MENEFENRVEQDKIGKILQEVRRERIHRELTIQRIEVARKKYLKLREDHEKELSRYTPMLEEAKKAVKSIDTEKLYSFIAGLERTPILVKRVLTNIVMLIDRKMGRVLNVNFDTVLERIRKPNFVKDLLSFEGEKLTEKQMRSQRHIVRGLSIESASNVNPVIGSLAKWLVLQVIYTSNILKLEDFPFRPAVQKYRRDLSIGERGLRRTEEKLSELYRKINSLEVEERITFVHSYIFNNYPSQTLEVRRSSHATLKIPLSLLVSFSSD